MTVFDQIKNSLPELGFPPAGTHGWAATWRDRSSGEEEAIPPSDRYQNPAGRGSFYAHKPGIIVATGSLAVELPKRVAPNGEVYTTPDKPYPAWRGEQAVALLKELEKARNPK